MLAALQWRKCSRFFQSVSAGHCLKAILEFNQAGIHCSTNVHDAALAFSLHSIPAVDVKAIIYLTHPLVCIIFYPMAIDANSLTRLLDALEDLLIENTALQSSVRVLEGFLPEAKGKVAQVVEKAKNDPAIRAHVQGRLAPLRDQIRTGLDSEKVIRELLKAVPTKKVN